MNHIFKYLLLLGAIIVGPVVPSLAHADISCNSQPAYTIYVTGSQTISVNNSLPNGTLVGQMSVSTPTYNNDSICSGAGQGLIFSGTGGAVPGYDNTYYQTSIPGLAYRIYATGGCGSGYYPLTCAYSASYGHSIAARTVTVYLYKVGPIARGGTLSGLFGTVYSTHSNGVAYLYFVQYLWNASFNVTVVNPTCSVGTADVKVPMGTVTNPHLASGQPFNSVDFNVQLNCSGGTGGAVTTAYMTLTDATVPGNRTNILNLSAGSTASGVGIQILRNGTPVSFGADSKTVGNQNQFVAGTSTGGNIVIPFTARYITTSPNATAGLVKGLATFTVAYQ